VALDGVFDAVCGLVDAQILNFSQDALVAIDTAGGVGDWTVLEVSEEMLKVEQIVICEDFVESLDVEA
jgi:hypothetical protein